MMRQADILGEARGQGLAGFAPLLSVCRGLKLVHNWLRVVNIARIS